MEIIGSVLNTSVPGIDDMLDTRDVSKLLEYSDLQLRRGAQRIAVNCGSRVDTETADLMWMVQEIQKHFEIPLVIDSPNPEAHREVIPHLRYGRPMINSVTAEKSRLEALMPLAKQYNAQVTALLFDESGMAREPEDRLRVLPVITDAADAYGIAPRDIYLDAGVFPISVDHQNGSIYLETLKALQERCPQFRTICGLNNISFGLPCGQLTDMVFLSVLEQAGQSAVYVELGQETGAAVSALKLLYGRDSHCTAYLKNYRAGLLIE